MSPPSFSIAVVDDDAHVRRSLQRLLRSSGYCVATHASGAEFLRCLNGDAPDCIVLDLHMPEVSGFEVQTQLKRGGRAIPVVVITGHDSSEARARAMRNGARAYVCKPIDANELLGAIDSVLTAPSGN
jgi:FixJ family two-component response regulator